MAFAWFRMYAEFASDPVVQSLSFDDQRHFVIALCLKCSGVLDREYPDRQTRMGVLRRGLGLDAAAFDETTRRLVAAGLIEKNWQPRNWDKRQFVSDLDPTATKRKQRQRLRESHGRVTRDTSVMSRTCHTAQNRYRTESESESEENIRAREGIEDLKAAYPKTANRTDWILAERSCLTHIESGSTWSELIAAASRYAAQCAATQRTGTQFVTAAHKLYDGNAWRDEFAIPPTKAEQSRDANVSAGLKWLEKTNAGN